MRFPSGTSFTFLIKPTETDPSPVVNEMQTGSNSKVRSAYFGSVVCHSPTSSVGTSLWGAAQVQAARRTSKVIAAPAQLPQFLFLNVSTLFICARSLRTVIICIVSCSTDFCHYL